MQILRISKLPSTPEKKFSFPPQGASTSFIVSISVHRDVFLIYGCVGPLHLHWQGFGLLGFEGHSYVPKKSRLFELQVHDQNLS
jgi:hypothetical protein